MTVLQRLFLLALIAVLPAIALQAYNQFTVREEREREVRRESLRLAQFAAGELDRIVENGRGLLLALSALPAVRDRDTAACSVAAAEMQKLFPQYVVIGAVDTEQRGFCSSAPDFPRDAIFAGPSMDLFHAAESFTVGFYAMGRLVPHPVLPLGMPFRDRDGKVLGFVYASLDPLWLERYFSGKPLGDGATLAVTDRDGTIVLRIPDNAAYVGTQFAEQYMRYVQAAEPGTDEIVGIDGVARFLGYVPARPPAGLYVGVGLTKSVALAATDRATTVGLVLIAAGMVLALVSAWLGGRYFFTRPIARLLAAAVAWGRGQFGVRAQLVEGRSEIAQLGRAFNDMAASLQAKQQENTALLATLEQRVAERTRTLEHEIAERRKAEEGLLQVRKLEAIGQLTGGIAHDFNNLLTAVLANLELARKRTAGHPVERFIDAAAKAAERGATLTQRLLAFGRRQQLLPESFELAAALEGMRDMLARSIGPQIRLSFDIEADLWPVRADRNQLELALLNLVLNARDAMANGGRITIAAANRSEPVGMAAEDFVLIGVSDTGAGMTPEVAAHALEPFFTTKPVGQGSGLGLSMVYGFALQSDGRLELRSAPGRGTTIELWLPRAESAVPAAAAQAVRSAAAGSGLVLVCDDDPDVLDCMIESLAEYGYRCIAAASGTEALHRLADEPAIDALVIDFAMPDANGATVAQTARTQRPGLPVLIVTGYMDLPGPEQTSLAFPALRKPFLPHELAEAVGKLIAQRSLASAVQR